MADCITPVFEFLTGLCGLCAKWKDSMDKLEEDLNSLKKASDELKSRYLDVKMKVETAEQDPNSSLVILNEVRGWMGRVEVLKNEVDTILPQGDEQTHACCFGGRCPKNCRACCKLHKMVTQKLSDVNDLQSKGNFHVVAEMYAHNRFDKLPGDKAVGVESTFEELCSCFEDNKVGTIGLYGIGGVGKTTLLKKFNNDFLSTKPLDEVIWVVASKDADPGKIQDGIRKKLGVEDHTWGNKTVDERARLLYNILNKKKFVLLLDDVWERIDLVNLGVPSPDNHECKIIFTTRSDGVCGRMDAKRCIKVNCLTREKAFELFKEKVGETTLKNPLIFDLAEQVVDECKGLPLALCTVGRAMANKVSHIKWKRAIEILRTHPSEVQGIVEDVYYLLEFSYDRLSDSYKLCFLYCALFPEDHNISKEDIILLWMAEGFLAEFNYDIHEARKQGEDIISNLKSACLLEDGDMDGTIKMHDVIRDLALWIACDHGKKTRFFTRDCSLSSALELYNHAKWKEVEKLSMWGGDGMIPNLSQKPDCPNLITLLVRDTKIQVFPTEVFVIPSTIKVLDLSHNLRIRKLPSEIGDFVSLEHLNLSSTGIGKLPKELKNLKKLRFLLLNHLEYLAFPKDVISSLLSLQAFSMIAISGYGVIDDENDARLQELEGLDHLEEYGVIDDENEGYGVIDDENDAQHALLQELEGLDHLEEYGVIDDENEGYGVADDENDALLQELEGLDHVEYGVIDDENEGYKVIDDENDALLQELEGLDHLQDIRITTVRYKSSVEQIVKSSKLQGRLCMLLVDGSSLHHDLISSLVKMEHLEELGLYHVDFNVVNIPRSPFWEHEHRTILLRWLTLRDCKNIVDLNWLVHAPNLEVLVLGNNPDSLVEVISEDFGTAADTETEKRNLFSSLTYLELSSLFKLRSICRMTLQFPCLKEIQVRNCPELKKLPFNSQSALNLRRFSGFPGLVDELQWEDEDTKHRFSSKFVRYPY